MKVSISRAIGRALHGVNFGKRRGNLADQTSIRRYGASLQAGLALALGLASGAAGAAAGAQGDVLEEIIVTARFKSEDLQQTPISITAVTGFQMEERGYRNILDVAQNAPNVTLVGAVASRGKSAQTFIRGVGQADFNFALEPAVAFYIDDVYHATVFGSIFELYDVDRVEVLRGPQGTLFGKNSEGGAVRFYSRKPMGDDSGYVEVVAGSYDGRGLKGAFDISLIENKLAMRVSAGYKQSDGYMDRLDYVCLNPTTSGRVKPQTVRSDCKVGTLGGEDVATARVALRFTPNDDLEINLIGNYLNDNGEPAPQTIIRRNDAVAQTNTAFRRYNAEVLVPQYGIPADSRFNSPDRFSTYATFNDINLGLNLPVKSTVENWGFSGTVDWKLPLDMRLRSITAYEEYAGEFSSDQGLGPFSLSLNYNTVDHHQFSQEFQLSGTGFNERLEWTTGLYYLNSYSRNGGYIDLPYTVRPATVPGQPGGLGLFFIQNDPANSHNKSVFAHAIYHFTDELSLEAGLRYSKDYKDYTYYRWMPNFHVPPLSLPTANPNMYPDSSGKFLLPITTAAGETESTDPKIALQYQWTSDFMTYVQYSTGYKAGGVNPRITIPEEALPFGKETLVAYELGAKSEWLNRRLRVNASLFFNDYQDLQQLVTEVNVFGTTSSIVRNVGKVYIKGVEAEVAAEPFDNFQINASAGYLDYEVKDTGGVNGITTDSKPPLVPDMKWNVGMQYAVQLGDYGTVTPRLDYTHQAKIFNDSANRQDNAQEAYGVLTARLGWTDPKSQWMAALTFLNALDEEYYLTRAYTSGLYEGQPARPQTWTFAIRRNF
ncbi:MAG: TonB-dependent receptor [Pseudomonadota bacterium]